jgi:charged multivesicular body protein 4A/B
MKKKKTYEQQLERLNAQQMNMETMLMKLEEATIDMETLKSQKKGADTIKKIYGKT